MPWVQCTVTMAGPAESGVIYIALREISGSFNNWFVAVPNMEKEMLAVALSALSSGRLCWAFVTDVVPYSTINRLYIRE